MFFSPLDCGVRRVDNFQMNKFIDCILRRVARNASIPVLTNSPDEIVCHADIQCTAGTAGENVDVVLFHQKAFRSVPPFRCHHRATGPAGPAVNLSSAGHGRACPGHLA